MEGVQKWFSNEQNGGDVRLNRLREIDMITSSKYTTA